MNKFLDDSKIIKKTNIKEEVLDEENFNLGLESTPIDVNSQQTASDVEVPSVTQEITEHVLVHKMFEEFKNSLTTTIENLNKLLETKIKTREEIIIELLNKTQTQLITKQVDIELYHKLYDNAQNTSERERYSRTYENLEREIKEVRKKEQILRDMIR